MVLFHNLPANCTKLTSQTLTTWLIFKLKVISILSLYVVWTVMECKVKCKKLSFSQLILNLQASPQFFSHLSVSAWCYCGCGFQSDSRFLHRFTDSEESDWNQPVPARHHGWRSCGLQLLGATTGQAVPHLRAAQQRAYFSGCCLQATG